MKNCFVYVNLLLLLFSPCAHAFEDCDLVLKQNETYMMTIDEKPTQIVVSEPNVLSVDSTSDLYNQSFYLIMKVNSIGSSNILLTTANGNKYNIRVKSELNPIVSGAVLMLDAPPGM